MGSLADPPGPPVVVWDFATGEPLWPACPWCLMIGSDEVFQSGRGAVAPRDVSRVSASCHPVPMEIVFSAVPPVGTGVPVVRAWTVKIEDPVPMGVREGRGMKARGSELVTFLAGANGAGGGRGEGREGV